MVRPTAFVPVRIYATPTPDQVPNDEDRWRASSDEGDKCNDSFVGEFEHAVQFAATNPIASMFWKRARVPWGWYEGRASRYIAKDGVDRNENHEGSSDWRSLFDKC